MGKQTDNETKYLGFGSGSVTNLLLTVDEPLNPLACFWICENAGAGLGDLQILASFHIP